MRYIYTYTVHGKGGRNTHGVEHGRFEISVH